MGVPASRRDGGRQPGGADRPSTNVYPVDYIVACDAGRGLLDPELPFGFLTRVSRSFTATFRKAQDASRARLHSFVESGQLQGFLMPYLGQQDDRLPWRPPDLVAREKVACYPTNLAPMPADMIDALTRRAEQLTPAADRALVPRAVAVDRPNRPIRCPPWRFSRQHWVSRTSIALSFPKSPSSVSAPTACGPSLIKSRRTPYATSTCCSSSPLSAGETHRCASRTSMFASALRGQRLREVSVEVLRRQIGPGHAIHYKQWYGLLTAAGHKVAGRDPIRDVSRPSGSRTRDRGSALARVATGSSPRRRCSGLCADEPGHAGGRVRREGRRAARAALEARGAALKGRERAALAPALLTVAVLFGGALAGAVMTSVTRVDGDGETVTLAAWRMLLCDPAFADAVLFTPRNAILARSEVTTGR